MPRLRCDVLGCGRRPILAVPYALAASDGADFDFTRAAIHRNDTATRMHWRLCRDHAAECGVEQLEQPRMFVQAKIDVPAVAAAVRDELVRMGRARGFA